MAIVKMNKFTLFAFENEKEALLKRLQEFEGVQFVDLNTKLEDDNADFLKSAYEDREVLRIENELSKVKFSLEFLNPYFKKQSTLKALKEGKKVITFEELDAAVKEINWNDIYSNLKSKEEKQNALLNEKAKIESEIENLKPWINFDARFDELQGLRYTKSFLGTIPQGIENELMERFENEISNSHFEIVNEGKDETYILAIVLNSDESDALKLLKQYGFAKATLNYKESPKEIIENYKKRIDEIKSEKSHIEEELKELSKYQEDIELLFEYYSNELDKAKSSINFIKSHTIVIIQGWNPVSSNKNLEDTIKSVVGDYYYLEFEEAKEDDDVPILLKNNKFVQSFESIVEMYSMPNYREIDPTPVMSIFYLVFFGMMLSDAAYGVILSVVTFIALKFFNLDEKMRRTVRFFCFAGLSTIFWGAIYGSWFGDAPVSLFGASKIPMVIDPASNIISIMILSLVLGGIHIFTGLAMKAYMLIRDKRYFDAFCDVFLWYVAIIGGILFLLGEIPSISKWMLILGLVGLALTQGRDSKSIIGKIGGGLYGVYGITSYVGDFVSYSRLLALGLATGFIGNAFNIMINLFPSPIKYIIGPIIFVVGHGFNMGINALGAYVHANRLQYLEFFGKFFEGGGKPFTPLKAKSRFFQVVKEK